MKNIKTLNYITVILILNLISCSSNKKLSNVNCQKKFKILDSISYTYFPNDNFGTEGNSVFKKIREKGELIKYCLIEKVIDTATSKYRVADSYNYKNGDLAVLLLPYVSKSKISLRKLLFDEFNNELKGKNKENDFFTSIYYHLFFANDKSTNYKNRLRLYRKLKKLK